jgi:hypothetical protein
VHPCLVMCQLDYHIISAIKPAIAKSACYGMQGNSPRLPHLASAAQQVPPWLRHTTPDLHSLANAAHDLCTRAELEQKNSMQAELQQREVLSRAAAEFVQNHAGGLGQNALNLKRGTPEDPGFADGADPVKKPRFDDANEQANAQECGAEFTGDEAEDCEESPFALMWIRFKMPKPFNHGAFGLKLRQVIKGAINMAVVSNFMIDFKWLLTACPDLLNASTIVLLRGDNQSGLEGQRDDVLVPNSCTVRSKVYLFNLVAPFTFYHAR